jgi:hypothetical protein
LLQLAEIVRNSGPAKHGELREMLKRDLGMGHGDANTLVHHVLNSVGRDAAAGEAQSLDQVVAGLCSGPKAPLRPIHDQVMGAIAKFGTFEIAPKKTYFSPRRRKQFAMIGPATQTRVEVGLNMTSPDEVDTALIAWLRKAFEAAA